MLNAAPPIDRRSAADVAGFLQEHFRQTMPEVKPTGAALALTNIFARYSEIIIDRMNRVPRKNFTAFLNLIGVSLSPPQPARVPLTFLRMPGGPAYVTVPISTQVAAPGSEEDTQPAVFETERELYVSAGTLVSLFVRDPWQDRYGDYSVLIGGISPEDAALFQGNRQVEHVVYIGHRAFFAHKQLQELRLTFHFNHAQHVYDPRTLQWEVWDGQDGIPITPEEDQTESLTKDGDVFFRDLPQIPLQRVMDVPSHWLRCRLLTPLTRRADKTLDSVRSAHVARIDSLRISILVEPKALPIEAAFLNNAPVDTSKEFYLFGEKPKLGDVLYLAQSMGFSTPGARVTLDVELVNPKFGGEEPSIPRAQASLNLRLRWEVWDGQGWKMLGTAEPDQETDDEAAGFSDTTEALTKSGTIRFTLPATLARTKINEVENFWVRARIIAGNYGSEASYDLKDPDDPAKGFVYKLPTLAPPMARAVTMEMVFQSPPERPDHIVTFNDFEFVEHAALPGMTEKSFVPFRPSSEVNPSLYLGLPSETRFEQKPMSVYFRLRSGVSSAGDSSKEQRLKLIWEYWNGGAWGALAPEDDTQRFTRSDLVRFVMPTDSVPRTEFCDTKHWIRVRLEAKEYPFDRRLQAVILNTVMATHSMTLLNEDLGSSNGLEKQTFRTLRAPVLPGQLLQVLELEGRDQGKVRQPETATNMGPAASEKEPIEQGAGGPRKVWVIWTEVHDFYSSGPHDPHYTLDHVTGEIHFGDGKHGRIPPAGIGNVRMLRYRTGGGATGNRPVGTITQLRTAVPYIQKAWNPEPASGGVDTETLDSVFNSAPRTLRHGGRAVTKEDYEDLALQASPEVARAVCVPLYHLAEDPQGSTRRPGVISVIIVPRSADDKPVPTSELLERVRKYLDERRQPDSKLCVLGPSYVRVDVDVELAVKSFDEMNTAQREVQSLLRRFLHPLQGGLSGEGWQFGQEPHMSALYARIEALPGVDHIRSLTVRKDDDQPGATRMKQFLIYSGSHSIRFAFPFSEVAGGE